VICDKLTVPLITVQHLSSPLLSHGECAHTRTQRKRERERERYASAGYDGYLVYSTTRCSASPRLFNLSINCSSVARHPLPLVSSGPPPLREIHSVFEGSGQQLAR